MSNELQSATDGSAAGAIAVEALRRGDRVCAVANRHGAVLAQRVRLALGPWTRLRGLLGGPALQAGEGMLLRPCRGVHTWGMRYAIDVLLLAADGTIVGLRARMPPWSATRMHPEALATLELCAGVADASGIEMGDRVVFQRRG